MQHLQSNKLQYIGRGANGMVYRAPMDETGLSLSAVVKSVRTDVKHVLEIYETIRHCGVIYLTFMEECRLDGKPAILMEDLTDGDTVYVSPNSVRHGYHENESEKYLLEHKIADIPNFESLIAQVRDLVHCTSSKGVELLMDTIFFGVDKNSPTSDVRYKLVDIDGLFVYPNSPVEKLKESNSIEIKHALQLFIEYFVEEGQNKQVLKQQLKEIELH